MKCSTSILGRKRDNTLHTIPQVYPVCVRGGPNQPLHHDPQWSIVLHRFTLLARARFQNVFWSKSHLNCSHSLTSNPVSWNWQTTVHSDTQTMNCKLVFIISHMTETCKSSTPFTVKVSQNEFQENLPTGSGFILGHRQKERHTWPPHKEFFFYFLKNAKKIVSCC
jgi:hypothetical protein